VKYDGAGDYTPACPIFHFMTMRICFRSGVAAAFLLPMLSYGQQPPKTAAGGEKSGEGITSAQAVSLAEGGHCKEAMPVLRKTLLAATSKEERKKAGVLGVRCAMAMDDRAAAGEVLGQLGKQFPNDSEVLYVLVHAYSDLSSRAAADLGTRAPQSVEAHKLNAEALELQGKWDDAAKEYEAILAKNPNQPGIHYLLGRVLLSKPDADDARLAEAKREMMTELEIDPKNAGAEYILGELARQASDWDEAIKRFSSAAKLDAGFGDAFWAWGFSLVSARRFEEAIAPLRTAVKLEPGNPSAHYNLGMALSRTGHTEEASQEFAIQKQLVEKMDAERNRQIQVKPPQ
jgi:tetratricopeptide (TPR) repeat protein